MTEKNKDYINFGDFARNQVGMQCQYASHYLRGLDGYPNLGTGLRFTNDKTGNYHDILIHKDDAILFKERLEKHQKANRG
jgi:hypothetical protein